MTEPYTEITIQGLVFKAPLRYSEGHTLSAIEAEQLNSVLHDNLRNNFAKRIKAQMEKTLEVEPQRTGLNATEVLELKQEFAQYSAEYQFTSASRRLPLDPVERTALSLAKDLVSEALRKKGLKPSDVPEHELSDRIAAVAANPKVRAEAERRVDATRSIAGDALDIGLGAP